MTTSPKSLSKRVAALFLGIVTALETALSPLGAAPAASLPSFSDLTPPSSIGRLVESHVGSGMPGKPDVIVIEDLHFNYSVQKNIAHLLDFLNEKGVVGPQIAVEGAAGEVDNSLLTDVASLDVRQELSDFLLQNGELTGTQYYSIMQGRPKMLVGVEDPALFAANREIFSRSYSLRMRAVQAVQKFENRLQTLVPVLLGSKALHLEKLRARFQTGRMDPESFWDSIYVQGQKLNLPLPAILSDFQSSMPNERAKFFMRADWIQAVLNYSVTLEAAYSRTPEERSLIQLSYELGLAGRALEQHTTLDEIRHVAGRIDSIAALVELLAPDQAEDFDLEAKDLQEALRASVDFYVAALMRNEPMLENTLKLIPQNAQANRSTVLVVGGFHADYLKRELTQRGLSFAIFVPRVDSHTATDEALYAKRYMGQRMTSNEVVEWLTKRLGTRGSPGKADAAGYIPPLSGIASWLNPLKLFAQKTGSLYGKNANGLYALNQLRNKLGEDLRFANSTLVSSYDLGNKAFDDDKIIPGGAELRSVLKMHGDAGIDYPVLEMEFVSGQTVRSATGKAKMGLKNLESLIEIQPISQRPGKFKALIHVDAVQNNEIFKQNPYWFWTLFVLHESAEFGDPNISHARLVRAGLDGTPGLNTRKKTSQIDVRYEPITTLYKSFVDVGWKSLDREVLERHKRRALLEANYYSHRYIREQQAKGRKDLTMAKLTKEDLGVISDFAWRNNLIPGTDIKTATIKDVKSFRPSDLTPEERTNAVRMRLEGRIVEQWFIGGAGTRLLDHLLRLLKEGVLKAAQVIAFYFIPLGKLMRHVLNDAFDELQNDPVEWGPTELLNYNLSVRRLVRENPSMGFSEDEALANQHLIVHVRRNTSIDTMRDFVVHHFYGFNPEHIYFSVDQDHHLLKYDSKSKSWVEDRESDRIVQGHGTADERIVRPNHARRLSANAREDELDENSGNRMGLSIADEILRIFRKGTGKVPMVLLHQRRVNNLMNLSDRLIDIDRDAFAARLVSQGHYMIQELVANPPLVQREGGEPKLQPGGLPQMVKSWGANGGNSLAPMDSVALGGKESKKMLQDSAAEAKERGEPPLLNLMAGYSSLPEYAKTLEKGLPFWFAVVDDANSRQVRLKPQLVSDDAGQDPALNPAAFYQQGVALQDLKTDAYSQLSVAAEKLRARNANPEFIALAKYYGFDIDTLGPGPTGGVSSHAVERELTRLRKVSKSPDAAPRRDQTSRKKNAAAALAPTQAHAFTAVMAVLLGLAFLFQAPGLVFAGMAPWAAAAFGQEATVIAQAVISKDASVLTSSKPIAWYDFKTQTEHNAWSVFAHGHELARALTQSDNAVIPRLFAFLTLPLAILDWLVAGVVMAFHAIAEFFGLLVPVDAEMLQSLQTNPSKVQQLLAEPALSAPPQSSSLWQHMWFGLQAMYKNSDARRAAAELAARQAVSGAA